MPFANVNQQNLYYEDSGGPGLPILFSHGFLMDHEMFDDQVRALAPQYRCIRWDERGHGKTGAVLEPFSYYDSADDAIALLRHLGITQAVFAGMSQGGFLTLRIALKYPDTVRALILLDTQAGTEPPEDISHIKPLVDEWLAHGLPDRTADYIQDRIGGPTFDKDHYWRKKWRTVSAANLLNIFQTLITRDDITQAITQITAPTLIVHGDADQSIPLERAQQMQASIRRSQFVAIRDAGHAANMTHAAEVNDHLTRFLNLL